MPIIAKSANAIFMFAMFAHNVNLNNGRNNLIFHTINSR